MSTLFDEPGLLWLPEIYRRAERVKPTDKAPRILPPIPDTGWVAQEYFPDLSYAKALSIDIETCDPELREKGPGTQRGAYIVGVSVATEDFAGYYPVAHSMGGNLDKAKVYAWLRNELGRARQNKIGAHILYDLEFLTHEGVDVKGHCYDVQYADPLIDEYEGSYSLEAIAVRRLRQHKETSLLYQWCADAYGGVANETQRANIWRAPVSLVGPYAVQDARLPLQILKVQWRMLEEENLLPIFRMECALIPLLLRMRQRGVRLDMPRVHALNEELTVAINTLKQDVGINVYAAAELQVLCDKEKIPYPFTPPSKNFPNGKPSFVKGWLLNHTHPVLRKVAQLRQLYKLRDTFIRGALLSTQIDGVVHCEFNPLRSDDYGTVSGRFSSSHPNLQQIPIRDKFWGLRVRACFIPYYTEQLWMKMDLSQIEYRLGVHFGLGEGIDEVREAYRNDRKTDFYSLAMAFTGLGRDESKSISLGTLYGMRAKKFARMTGRNLHDAQQLFQQFNARLPFMQKTYEHYALEAEERGQVETIGGRVCRLDPDYTHKALNRKLQGSCADWIKRSMLTAYQAGIFDVLDLYLTVHDELDVGIPVTQEGVEAAKELHHLMTHAYKLNIPVLAGIDLGHNWGELRDIEPEHLTLDKLTEVHNGKL